MSLFTFIRVLHVLLGAFWAGALFHMAIFVEPVVRSLGPDGGKVMGALNRRRFTEIMLTVAALTILTGIYVFWGVTGGFAEGSMDTPFAMIIGTGAVLGFVAFLIGLFVTRPTLKRLNAMGAAVAAGGGPPDPATAAQMDRLRGRMRAALRTIAALLLLATLAMGAARWV